MSNPVIVIDGIEKDAKSALQNALHPPPVAAISSTPSTPLSIELGSAIALLLDSHVSGIPLDAESVANTQAAIAATKPEIAAKLGIKI